MPELKGARELTDNDVVEYRAGNLEELNVPEKDFDLIYSALVFHYIEDFDRLCRCMRGLLKVRGRLVASIEHPVFTAPTDDRWLNHNDKQVWPLDNYHGEGQRSRNWFADGVIKYHRTVETYVNTLLDSGFQLSRLIEWCPSAEQIAARPEWAPEVERPMFLIFAADAT